MAHRPRHQLAVDIGRRGRQRHHFLADQLAAVVLQPVADRFLGGAAQHGGEETPPHAWITAFAPAYKPEIVVTVLVDSGGEGSKTAAPIAKEVLDAYFRK